MGLLSAASAAPHTAVVRLVLDGDTLILADGQHVRMIGINAPELGKDGAPDQPLARASWALLAKLTKHQRITLTFERERRDRYNRTLAHVLLPDGQSVEEIMLRQGLAWMVAVPPNVDQLARLQAAENEARRDNLGVWNEAAYKPMTAEKLTPSDTGFHLVAGQVQAARQGRQVIYLNLTPGMALVVPSQDWKKYFAGKPADFVGKRVTARGWITDYKGRLHMRVPHPAMLTLAD